MLELSDSEIIRTRIVQDSTAVLLYSNADSFRRDDDDPSGSDENYLAVLCDDFDRGSDDD